jgi:hypothetical protein
MEYVVVRAVHPTWLNMQLPTEVAQLIQYRADEVRSLRAPGRGIAFLARGSGVVRVLPTWRAGEWIALETMRNRFIAPAQLTEKLLFNLPEAVARYLELRVQRSAAGAPRFTDDTVVWFLPASEYYDFRARERAGRPWTGPSGGGFTHVYLARSLLPIAPELDAVERRIETEEGKPRAEPALRPSLRVRRPAT